MLVSTGERVTMALLSIAIHARGADAISFTGSQSGHHHQRSPLRRAHHRGAPAPHRGRARRAGEIVIVAGYQGMSYRREITTLGRGGSDTTAVALAAALGAERCEIYSDVDGVYSADPRVVPEAEHLPEIDLASSQEMAEAGAKVLNAQAVEWARRAKIAIHARKTSRPGGRRARDRVRRDAREREARCAPSWGSTASCTRACRRASCARSPRRPRQLDVPLLDVRRRRATAPRAPSRCSTCPTGTAAARALEERLRGADARAGLRRRERGGRRAHDGARGRCRGSSRCSTSVGAPPRAVHAGPLRIGGDDRRGEARRRAARAPRRVRGRLTGTDVSRRGARSTPWRGATRRARTGDDAGIGPSTRITSARTMRRASRCAASSGRHATRSRRHTASCAGVRPSAPYQSEQLAQRLDVASCAAYALRSPSASACRPMRPARPRPPLDGPVQRGHAPQRGVEHALGLGGLAEAHAQRAEARARRPR